ncbi:hypothetical protein Tco_0817420 [Tanacetum coccineum]
MLQGLTKKHRFHFLQEEMMKDVVKKLTTKLRKFSEIFRDYEFRNSFTDALMLMPKFASTLKTLIRNKEKLSEMARTPLNENCSAVILNKLPKKLGDPGRFAYSSEILRNNTATPWPILAQAINLMHIPRMDPTSPEVDLTYYDPDGDILLLKAILNSDPSPPPPNQGNYFPETRKDLKICEANSSVNEPPEVELKDLPPHLEYAFLEDNDKLPDIIQKI